MPVDGEERVEGQETQETATEAEIQEQPGAEPEITLDGDGGLDIPDSFWEEAAPEAQPKEPDEPKPEYYSPEDFAKAYASGQVDESRIDPAIADYYRHVAAAERQRRDAAELQRRAMEQAPPPPQTPQVTWDQMMEGGKILASRYLGIRPEDFDEFDERHKAARLMALSEIRETAQERARQERQARQAYEANLRLMSEVYSEYRQKVPEMDEIGERYFSQWKENLTVAQHRALEHILAQGTADQKRQLVEKVIADYRAAKAPQRKAAPAPPEVMRASGAAEESPQGMADASKLGDMSPEEQAEWLIRNKFVA